MYNITIIFSMHLEIGRCNSKELHSIIESEKPEIIFEEFDISRTNDEYYKNGHYKKNESTLETKAIMNFLEHNAIKHIPVDTYDFIDPPRTMYKIISETNCEYNDLFRKNILMAGEQGFSYLNSIECSDLFERMHSIEKDVVEKLNDRILFKEYTSWQLNMNNRDKQMLENIYEYSKNNCFNNALFLVGAEHKKSILNKINEYIVKDEFKIKWKSWRIA